MHFKMVTLSFFRDRPNRCCASEDVLVRFGSCLTIILSGPLLGSYVLTNNEHLI